MSPRGNVLIVDDEPSLRQTLTRVLQFAGCAVTTAADGREALRLIDGNTYDLIYLDIHLPDMGGLDVLKEIHQRQPDIPVILCTGFSEQINEKQAREAGIRELVMKPYATGSLNKIIRKVLAKE